MITIARPLVSESAIAGVCDVLRSRWIGQGPKVDEFEREFERKFGVENAVAVNSGTSALELAYELLNLGPGDEVITTPLTCTATNIPLVRRGCDLVFADIRRDTLNIDAGDVARKITSRTKAIINVHLHGVKSTLPDFGIPVVTDSAQALGLFGGRFTACSFQAIKTLTTGDGGMLICERMDDADKARLWRWFGIDRRRKLSNGWQPYKNREILFDIHYPGYKFQMNDIAAALGIAGLRELDGVMELRAEIFRLYREEYGLPMVTGDRNMYGYACALVDERDRFAELCMDGGVETNVMQVRNDLYSIFAPFRSPLPSMDWAHERHICLPLHNAMTIEDAHLVGKVASRALDRIGGAH